MLGFVPCGPISKIREAMCLKRPSLNAFSKAPCTLHLFCIICHMQETCNNFFHTRVWVQQGNIFNQFVSPIPRITLATIYCFLHTTSHNKPVSLLQHFKCQFTEDNFSKQSKAPAPSNKTTYRGFLQRQPIGVSKFARSTSSHDINCCHVFIQLNSQGGSRASWTFACLHILLLSHSSMFVFYTLLKLSNFLRMHKK